MIEELLLIDGIEIVFHNFNNINKSNVLINIKYNDSKICRKEILEIEKKFNL